MHVLDGVLDPVLDGFDSGLAHRNHVPLLKSEHVDDVSNVVQLNGTFDDEESCHE